MSSVEQWKQNAKDKCLLWNNHCSIMETERKGLFCVITNSRCCGYNTINVNILLRNGTPTLFLLFHLIDGISSSRYVVLFKRMFCLKLSSGRPLLQLTAGLII